MMKRTIVSLISLTIIVFTLNACGDSGSGGYAPQPPEQMPVQQGGPQPQDLGGALPGQAVAPAENPPADVTPPEGAPVDAPAEVTQVPTPPVTIAQPNSVPAVASALPQACSAQRVPGSYISITAPGRMNGTTFIATSGAGVWQRMRYATAGAGGKTKPKASTPGQRTYVYSGTYTIKRSGTVDTIGCVTLATAQNGTSLSAQPRFTRPAHGTTVASGAVTKLTVTRLSASGGNGSFQLSNGLTGTIKLTSRARVP